MINDATPALGRLTFAGGVTLRVIGDHVLHAQQPSITRKEVLRTEMLGMDGKEAHMWVGEVAPRAATGLHRHPTPRFVYVTEGSVVLEIEGKPPQTFRAGEGFMKGPDIVHNFRNATPSQAAKALGFQIAGKGQALQY